jgi:hypothetical protein
MKIVFWAKPPLNDALPLGSAATWTEQHPHGSSVSSYLCLEGQGSNDPQPGILRYDEIFLEEKACKAEDKRKDDGVASCLVKNGVQFFRKEDLRHSLRYCHISFQHKAYKIRRYVYDLP